MAFTRNGDVRLHWREDGAGPPLLLLHSVGCDLSLWDGVMPHLQNLRVIRMDLRGHGESDSPPGEYTLDQIAADVIAVLQASATENAAVCGLSLGGMVAMSLALAAPERVWCLILACTSARMDPEIWNARIALARNHGMAAIAETVIARFFSERFRKDHPTEVEAIRRRFLDNDPKGYTGCCAAIRDMALMDKLSAIAQPTLVIAGEGDVATPFSEHGGNIQARIRGARAVLLPAGHLAPLEAPAAFAHAVTDFLSGISHD